MWEICTKFPLKNVGDSHIIPREKCGIGEGVPILVPSPTSVLMLS